MTGVLADRSSTRYSLPSMQPDGARLKETGPERPSRRQVLVFVALLAAELLLFVKGYAEFQVGTYKDDAAYAVLAQSIVRSDRYGLINLPGEPGPTQFPFGFPLLLSPFVLLFPDNPDSMKSLSLVATLLNATLLFFGWRWLGAGRSYWWAVAVAGLYLLSPVTVDHARMVMSEAVFTTLCLMAFLLLEGVVRGKVPRWWSLPLSIVLMFALFTRTIGITLVMTAFLYLWLRMGRQAWKGVTLTALQMGAAVALIVAVTPVRASDLVPAEYVKSQNASFLTAAWNGLTGSANDAGRSMSASTNAAPAAEEADVATILSGDTLYFAIKQHLGRDVRRIVLPLGGGSREEAFGEWAGIPSLPLTVGYSASAMVIVGLVRWFRRGLSSFLLFAIVYSLSIFMWEWSGVRLLYPIQPQTLFGFLLGLEGVVLWIVAHSVRSRPAEKTGMRALALVVVALIVVSTYKSATLEGSRTHVGDLRERTAWLKANTPPSTVVMSEEPVVDFLYGGHKTVPYPDPGTSKGQLEDYFTAHNVRYVVAAPDTKWQSVYRTAYSDSTTLILSQVRDLSAQGRVRPVYSPEESLVRLFQVEP